MVGQSITRIVPSEKRDELADILARLGRGERIDHHETMRVAKDGRRIDVSVSISPLADRSGRVIGAVKIGRDISARREAESLREDFLAAVSHDLKNPLGGLKAHAQLLLRALRRGDPPDLARLTRGLEAIDEAATRLTGQIDDLVDAARLQPGVVIALERTPVDLVALPAAAPKSTRRRRRTSPCGSRPRSMRLSANGMRRGWSGLSPIC